MGGTGDTGLPLRSAQVLRYVRAWRAGLRRSSCLLGDPRWVITYLGLAAVAGIAWTVHDGYLGLVALRHWLGWGA